MLGLGFKHILDISVIFIAKISTTIIQPLSLPLMNRILSHHCCRGSPISRKHQETRTTTTRPPSTSHDSTTPQPHSRAFGPAHHVSNTPRAWRPHQDWEYLLKSGQLEIQKLLGPRSGRWTWLPSCYWPCKITPAMSKPFTKHLSTWSWFSPHSFDQSWAATRFGQEWLVDMFDIGSAILTIYEATVQLPK